MDRASILRHLELAERHVAEGERHVARQREIVAELGGDGRDLESAQKLLAIFEELLMQHIFDRDRLRKVLAA